MWCPKCLRGQLKVIDTQEEPMGNGVKRRRECIDCGYRFNTFEYAEDHGQKMIEENQMLREMLRNIAEVAKTYGKGEEIKK